MLFDRLTKIKLYCIHACVLVLTAPMGGYELSAGTKMSALGVGSAWSGPRSAWNFHKFIKSSLLFRCTGHF